MYKGVDPTTVKGITSYIGSIYKNYSNDPIEKMVVLSVAMLACAQFFVKDHDYFNQVLLWFCGLFGLNI